jgi:uncharacterized membrane protein YgdD (TMEM256/DUF423 family)
MTTEPNRRLISLAALNGFLAVAAGAFGAHAMTDPHLQQLLRTAAEYQLASAAVGLGILALPRMPPLAATLILAGGLIFGLSIDAIVFTGIKAFGAITPVGGVCMLGGFGWLGVSMFRKA